MKNNLDNVNGFDIFNAHGDFIEFVFADVKFSADDVLCKLGLNPNTHAALVHKNPVTHTSNGAHSHAVDSVVLDSVLSAVDDTDNENDV